MARKPAATTATEQLVVRTYPKQQAFLDCPKRRRAFCAGRGAGKSRAGAIDLCLKAKPGGVYFVIAPTYATLDGTVRTFVEVATQFGLWDPARFWSSKPPRAILKSGAEILFRSGDDPEALRGGDKAGVWLDEMQNSDEDVYRIVEPCLRQWGQLGWMTCTFTPGSPDHWTSHVFITPVNPQDVGIFRASLKDNPFAPPGLYEELLRSWAASPLRIKRELDGECVYMEGAEWDPSYFEDCDFDEWPDALRGGIKVLSLDSSKGKGGKTGDYSAFVKTLFVDDLLYLDADMRNDRDANVISQTGVELYCEWQPDYFVVEEEMGQDMLIANMHRIADEREILMAITPMGTDKIQKEVRIRRWTPYISRRQLRFKSKSPGAKLLKEQFASFPLGIHDDGPDAGEYGLRMLIKATTGQVYPPRTAFYTPMGGVV